MRHFKLLVLLVFLLSCEQTGSLRAQLEGSWTFEHTLHFGDTLFWFIEDNFDEPSRSVAVRKLDSGFYKFISEDSALISVTPYLGLSVKEFRFLTDTSGYSIEYQLDESTQRSHQFGMVSTPIVFQLTGISKFSGYMITEGDSLTYRTTLEIYGSTLRLLLPDGEEQVLERRTDLSPFAL